MTTSLMSVSPRLARKLNSEILAAQKQVKQMISVLENDNTPFTRHKYDTIEEIISLAHSVLTIKDSKYLNMIEAEKLLHTSQALMTDMIKENIRHLNLPKETYQA